MEGENEEFDATFTILKNSFRFQMKERIALHPRYETSFSIELLEKNTFTHSIDSKGTITAQFDRTRLVIEANPFRFKSFVNGVQAMEFNDRGYLYYEPYRSENRGPSFATVGETVTVEEDPLVDIKRNLNKDLSQESFNGHTDSKPRGPSSVGFDVSFPGSKHVFGIPEHASSFALKSTRGKSKVYEEPYRLYNLDVFEYILDTPMALYGAVPFMMSHKKGLTSGILFLNSAEMWIDIENDDYSRSHWMAESGILDLFVFEGPTQQDVFDQYTKLTGRPQLPQKFSVGYHQCRWNYNSEDDALEVDSKFDENEIPYDVLWLDIEHTDGKRYFTWDNDKFPNPVEMQETLARKGRKMVTIIDPHMKADDDYYVTKNARPKNIFVKTKEDKDFEGHCWPGGSYWIDYSNPEARKYWAEQFKFENYKHSTPSLYTWNDMNEPSVFTGPEITMPKDVLHHGKIEHRDIHNAYGMLFHRSTYEGHLLRSDNKDRPFVLSRAFFVGTQRYGCIWTGDNTGDWKHLEASVPMLLSIGISGITNAGADVGGFFLNPDGELLLRWYQIGSLQPFFRAHAHIDTKRREPWLFGEPYTSLMGKAVERRFRMLPYIYTTFEESSRTGNPIMRSMMQEFPDDEHTFGMDSQYMFGPSILVKPVTEAGQKHAETYLPKDTVLFVDLDLVRL
jgi:alpha 1,3-glucosidase